MRKEFWNQIILENTESFYLPFEVVMYISTLSIFKVTCLYLIHSVFPKSICTETIKHPYTLGNILFRVNFSVFLPEGMTMSYSFSVYILYANW